MKVRIISLILSVAFLSILTFEYISNTIIFENSESEAVEYIIKKRLADKYVDDINLLLYSQNSITIISKPLHCFTKKLKSLEISHPLFKPPITL